MGIYVFGYNLFHSLLFHLVFFGPFHLELQESNVKLKLTVVNTVGFGDQINKEERLVSLSSSEQVNVTGPSCNKNQHATPLPGVEITFLTQFTVVGLEFTGCNNDRFNAYKLCSILKFCNLRPIQAINKVVLITALIIIVWG